MKVLNTVLLAAVCSLVAATVPKVEARNRAGHQHLVAYACAYQPRPGTHSTLLQKYTPRCKGVKKKTMKQKWISKYIATRWCSQAVGS